MCETATPFQRPGALGGWQKREEQRRYEEGEKGGGRGREGEGLTWGGGGRVGGRD